MECPHCHQALPSKICPRCHEEVPEESRYCMECGASFETSLDSSPGDNETDVLDLENRILCPDGTCTGIIENGRCTECGRTVEEIRDQESEDPPEKTEPTHV